MFQIVTGLATLLVAVSAVGSHAQDPSAPPAAGDTRKPDPVPVVPPKGHTPADLVTLGAGSLASPYAFVFDKANRTLSVWKNDRDETKFVTAVPADFGRNSGNKSSSGDYKTPEGIYYFQQLRENEPLDFEQYGTHAVQAFTLDYPNYFDQLESKSGSGIWLHTLPDHLSLWRGSKGCVVVRADVMKELSQYITLKRTPLLIKDSVKYLTAEAAKEERKTWNGWLNSWKEAWQAKSISTYIAFYSSEFKSQGMDQKQWENYKKGLAEKYAFIKVSLIEPVVLVHQDKVMIKFIQDYQSDKNADYGEKTLYLKKNGSSPFQIISEEWQAVRRDGIVATH